MGDLIVNQKQLDEWLAKAINDIHEKSPEETIQSLEKYGLVEPDYMQELVEETERLGLYDETK